MIRRVMLSRPSFGTCDAVFVKVDDAGEESARRELLEGAASLHGIGAVAEEVRAGYLRPVPGKAATFTYAADAETPRAFPALWVEVAR